MSLVFEIDEPCRSDLRQHLGGVDTNFILEVVDEPVSHPYRLVVPIDLDMDVGAAVTRVSTAGGIAPATGIPAPVAGIIIFVAAHDDSPSSL
ncbi:hypothetical protein CO683_39170 [Bradyrhizobium ottawaense]|nr:hypothetical protein CO683_39170 [Bradyrhizobium ottawaense]